MFGDVESGQCNQRIISSDPIKVLPCIQNCVKDSETERQQNVQSLFPGQDFDLVVAAVGQENGLTPAILLFSSNHIILDKMSPNTTQIIGSQNTTQIIGAQCTTITKTLLLRENIKQALLTIAIADESIPTSVNAPIEFYVGVLPCPPGFNLTGDMCECTNSLQNLATCNIANQSIQRHSNHIWILPQNDSTMISWSCPFDYCNDKSFHIDEPDEQCDHNRSGILCGECLSNYSLMLGSNQCRNCTDQVWHAPIIVLGSILAGIGLVAVLIGLNLTVSVGTMNGFIFFVNIVKTYEPVFASETFHPILRYCISWINLDLGIPSCFIPGMTACHKIGLQFVFPLYLLSILALVTVICKAGQWRGFSSSKFVRLVSGNVTLLIGSKAIPVFATLILLSYTKILRTTITIFHKATIITTDCGENTSVSTCKNFTVWYVDGNTNYTSGCHRFLFGIAVGIFSPLVVLFTSFMLFFPLMERYLPRFNCWSSWHMRLKPWYDAYGGPYKDEYRSWTGVLLLARFVLALFAALENDSTINISVLLWGCVFLNSFLSFNQVYKLSLLNSLELMYLACLLIIAFFSSPNYRLVKQANVVAGLMLCSLVFITSYHVYHQLTKMKHTQEVINKTKTMFKELKCKKTKKEEISTDTDAKTRAHTTTVLTLQSVQPDKCRESVLELEV